MAIGTNVISRGRGLNIQHLRITGWFLPFAGAADRGRGTQLPRRHAQLSSRSC
jgi:hypothetical protein